MAVARSDAAGQRRRILLVQLYQSAADSRCGFPGGRRFGADGAGRIRHVRGQLGRRPPCRTAIRPGAGGRLGAGDYLRCPAADLFLRAGSMACRRADVRLHDRAVRGVESSAAPAAAPFRGRRAARGGPASKWRSTWAMRSEPIAAACRWKPVWDTSIPALIGAPFALAGFVLLTVFYRRYEPSAAGRYGMRNPLRMVAE